MGRHDLRHLEVASKSAVCICDKMNDQHIRSKIGPSRTIRLVSFCMQRYRCCFALSSTDMKCSQQGLVPSFSHQYSKVSHRGEVGARVSFREPKSGLCKPYIVCLPTNLGTYQRTVSNAHSDYGRRLEQSEAARSYMTSVLRDGACTQVQRHKVPGRAA